MKVFDLTADQSPSKSHDHLLVIDEKVSYIADLLETALQIEYLK